MTDRTRFVSLGAGVQSSTIEGGQHGLEELTSATDDDGDGAPRIRPASTEGTT